jgi:uncharacterized protein (DUF1697 family)
MTDRCRYVALLRGINVGGHKVTMDRLRAELSGLGLTDVRSYIASGNLFFDTDSTDRDALTDAIESRLRASLGFAVATFLRTPDELRAILDDSAFTGRTPAPDERLMVHFSKRPMTRPATLPLWSTNRDMELVDVDGPQAYVVWHLINGRPPTGRFDPPVVPDENTGRFFHTLEKIHKAAIG